jgi:hypothetical protein
MKPRKPERYLRKSSRLSTRACRLPFGERRLCVRQGPLSFPAGVRKLKDVFVCLALNQDFPVKFAVRR